VRFSNPRAPEEREGDGESIPDPCVAGGEPAWLASWLAAMDLCGARGQGARKPQNARELDGERAEGEGSSPARRTGSKEAQFGPLALGESRRRSGDGSRCLHIENRGGEGRNEEWEQRHWLGRGVGEDRGSGAARAVLPQQGKERGRERLGRRGKELTSGPRLSVRERGKGEKGRLGRGPGRKKGGAGEELGRKAESREKRGKGKFHFLFCFKYIFFPLAFFFQMNF